MNAIVYPSDWQVVGTKPEILVRADLAPQEVELSVFDLDEFRRHGAEHSPPRVRVNFDRGPRWLEGSVDSPLQEGKYVLCLRDMRHGRVMGLSGIEVKESADRWAMAFHRMLQTRMEKIGPRAAKPTASDASPLFSVLTTVYDTDPLFLDVLVANICEQTFGDFEWLILDNGSTSQPTISALASAASRDQRIRLFRVENNLHIIGGNRYLLERACGRFVIPVDSDDIVYPDAFEVVAKFCAREDAAAVFFSDEQKVSPTGLPVELMWRPAWSTLYALGTCPASHLMAYDRERGLAAGAYSDDYARGSHDWDTMLRLADAGARPVRIAEVLYGWRMHPGSAALTEEAKDYVRASQAAVLERSIERRGLASLFALEPAIPAIGYYHFVRKQVSPRPMAVDFVLRPRNLIDAATLLLNLRRTRYPDVKIRVLQIDRARHHWLGVLRTWFPDVTWEIVDESELRSAIAETPAACYAKAIVDSAQALAHPDWLWDVVGTLELDEETGIVTGPIVDRRNRVRSIGYFAGLDGFFGTPLPSQPITSVYGTLGLLRRHVSAAHSGFLVLRTGVTDVVGPPKGVDEADALFGIEFCMRASEYGVRTAYTPRMKATRVRKMHCPIGASDPAFRERIAEQHASRLGLDPYYARYLVQQSSRYGELQADACR